MKRKVGELYNVPIVEGDPNLLKTNEILHKGGGQLSKRNNTGKIEDLGNSDSGEDSGDSESIFEYLDVSGYDFTPAGKMGLAFRAIVQTSTLIKINQEGQIFIYTPIVFRDLGMNDDRLEPITQAFAINKKIELKGAAGSSITSFIPADSLRESLKQYDIDYDSIPRLTEEEFYNLEV